LTHLHVPVIPELSIDYEHLTSELNTIGESGWELMNVFDVNIGEGVTASIVAIFKRPA
jgi:hypothetical protein